MADVVDVLIGASAFALAYAAIGTATDLRDAVIAGAIALLGVGLMIEPNVTAQPAGDANEPEPARPEPEAIGVSRP